MARITPSASNLGSTTTVAPMVIAAMATGPAAWVRGALARQTGSEAGIRLPMVSISVPQLRLGMRTPLGAPVVPPVAMTATRSEGSPTGSPSSGKTPSPPLAMKACSDGCAPSGPSRQTRCLTLGTRAFTSAASAAKLEW